MANSAERESAISILRACLLSNKGGTGLSILNRDYYSLVGDPIPYRKLGYPTVEDFLRSIKDICVAPGPNGELVVKARPTEASAHIASLVNRQKTTQKKRVPIPNYCQSRKPANHSWKPPPSSHKAASAPKSNHLSVTVNNNVFEKPSRLVTLRNKSSVDESRFRYDYELPPRLQKVRDDASRSYNDVRSENIEPVVDYHRDMYDSNFSSNFTESCSLESDFETGVDDFNSYQSGIPQKSRKSILSPFSPRNAIAAGRAKTEAMAAKELEDKYATQQIVKEELEVEEQFEDYNMDVAPWNRRKPGVGKISASSYEDTYVMRLSQYCAKKGLPEPAYKVIPRYPKSGGTLYCYQVKAAGEHYSSYPDESFVKEEAKEFAAKKAFEKLIKSDKDSANGLKVTTDFNTILERIYELVENRLTGLWADSITALYTDKYKELLPPDWMSKACICPRLSIEKVCEGKYIISPSSGPSLEDTEELKSTKVVRASTSEPSKPPAIHTQVLPSTLFWEVFVTYVAPTGVIWLRIIGDEYSALYENMDCEMELYYINAMNNLPSPPHDLKVGGYFAARLIDEFSSGENWHRVCVQDIDWTAKTAKCWLIDNGDSEIISYNQIYSLAEKFTTLPRQAVLCSLAGLKDYVVDEVYVDTMVKMLVGKILVAQVIKSDDVNNDYSLILFDTNGEDDLNLNEELIGLISLENSKPELPEVLGVKEVFVSHIKDDGQIYVQIPSDVFTHLQTLISDLDPDSILKHCFQFAKQIKTNRIYLAKYDEDGNWYRATVNGMPSSTDMQVQVAFVDYGNTALVDVKNVCDLEPLSDVLSRIPKQALLVSLHGMDDICPEDCAKLKEMISDTDPVVLKMISSGDVPSVEIFKRATVEGGALISINNSISYERNLLRSSQRRSTRRSRSSSRPATPSVSRPASPVAPFVDTIRHSLSPPVIPNGPDFFDVLVTMVAHPHNFIVQPLNNLNELKQLLAEMNKFYSEDGTNNCVSSENLVEGGLYAALFENDQWYRVTLTSIVGDIISIHSCDFGEYTVVTADKLRYLAPKFTALPYQGIKAKLTGIVPIHGDWKNEDSLRFHDLVADKLMVSVIKEKGPDVINPGVTVLGLQLIDTSTDEDIIISHILIREKRAVLMINNQD